MGFRSPALDVSALSPAEYDLYNAYLGQILEAASSANKQHDSNRQGIDDKVEKQVVKQFMVDQLGVDGGLVDQLISRIASLPVSRLSIGEIFAILRFAAHARSRQTLTVKDLEDDLVFLQIEPLTTAKANNFTNYEPRRRTSMNRLKEPISGRSSANATPSPQTLGLNTRRLPPEAPPTVNISIPPSQTSTSTSTSTTPLTITNPPNPFSPAAQSKIQSATKAAPPPLPPKPGNINTATPSSDMDELSPRSLSSNPFRQRLQSTSSATPTSSPKPPLDKPRSTPFSPPLPPRHHALDIKDKDGRHAKFTPSTKSASITSSLSAGPSRLLAAPTNGPSGFVSYPTAPLIKDGLMAADLARSRSGSLNNKSGSASSGSLVHVIKRSGDFKLIPDSTGGSTASSGMGDGIELADGVGGRRRSGSVLALKSSTLNPFEQGSSVVSTSSNSNRITPPQASGIYVAKAPPAPPPREMQKMRLSMPLPPPRRKPSIMVRPPTAESLLSNQPRASGLARRSTLGSGSQSEARMLFAQAAEENPATDSSDDGNGRTTELQSRRRASGFVHHQPRISGSTVSTPASIRDNIGKVASDMKGEWEWLKGGRGERWGAAAAAATGAGGGDDEEDRMRKTEKERLVNDVD